MACRSIVPPTEASLAETLAHRARHTPDRRVFAFLADGITASATLSFGELHGRALEVATWLRESAAPGDRVLLVFQPGILTHLGEPLEPPFHVPLFRVRTRGTRLTSRSAVRKCPRR